MGAGDREGRLRHEGASPRLLVCALTPLTHPRDLLVCKVFTVGVLPAVEGRIVPGAQNPRTWPSGREGNASEGWACA